MSSRRASAPAAFVVLLLASSSWAATEPRTHADNAPVFTVGLAISGSKINRSGQTRFCVRVTTKPPQVGRRVILRIASERYRVWQRTLGRYDTRGRWTGSIVVGSRRFPARGPFFYDVNVGGRHIGVTGGNPRLGKPFQMSGEGVAAPACPTPT